MKRREFIAGLGGVAAWPLAARAQQAKMPVVVYLYPNQPDTAAAFGMTAFLDGLKECGYIEGRNVAIEYRWIVGRKTGTSDFPRSRPISLGGKCVIVPTGTNSALAAKSATMTIPIVFQREGRARN
jgi:putative tryptophan/tyrosine transport system substrate-binding protein